MLHYTDFCLITRFENESVPPPAFSQQIENGSLLLKRDSLSSNIQPRMNTKDFHATITVHNHIKQIQNILKSSEVISLCEEQTKHVILSSINAQK